VEHLAVSHSEGSALNLDGNVRATKKELARHKHSSLFCVIIQKKEKGFIIF
jgi:hypothetical protein